MESFTERNAINILHNLNCKVVHCVIGEVGHFGAGQLCSLSEEDRMYQCPWGVEELLTYQGSSAENPFVYLSHWLVTLLCMIG